MLNFETSMYSFFMMHTCRHKFSIYKPNKIMHIIRMFVETHLSLCFASHIHDIPNSYMHANNKSPKYVCLSSKINYTNIFGIFRQSILYNLNTKCMYNGKFVILVLSIGIFYHCKDILGSVNN